MIEEPEKSDVQSENSITEDQGKEIIQSLLKEGFNVIPSESGLSLDMKNYKIAITKPRDDARLAILVSRMEDEGFTLVNTGALGPLIFSAAIRREES